jgi:hypothetical protein
MDSLLNKDKKCNLCNQINIENFAINNQINDEFFKNKNILNSNSIYLEISKKLKETENNILNNGNEVIYICENCLKIALDQKFFGFEINNSNYQNINFIYYNFLVNNGLNQMIDGYKKINSLLLDKNIQIYKNIQSMANKLNEIIQTNQINNENQINNLFIMMNKLNYIIELLKKVANPENNSRILGKNFIAKIENWKNDLIRNYIENKILESNRQYQEIFEYLIGNLNHNINYNLYLQGMKPIFKK